MAITPCIKTESLPASLDANEHHLNVSRVESCLLQVLPVQLRIPMQSGAVMQIGYVTLARQAHLWTLSQSPSNGDPLLLPSREGVCLPLCKAWQIDRL